LTEGKGFVRRRQEMIAEKQLKEDLENLDKIIVIPSKDKRKKSVA
jgi:hypothetical protein